jgi:hypothetical protein
MREQKSPSRIECLACGEVRVVTGTGTEARGECPRCHYLGWAYSDELDGSTRRQIMNGALAVPPAERPRRGRRRRFRFV